VRVVVIGCGFGGLAAAIRLQQQGHDVTILEKRDKPGGRAYVYVQNGFTFDGGPTIITAPWLIRELFERSGKRAEDYVELVRIDPFYNIRFDDGSVFRYSGNRAEVIEQIKLFKPSDVEGYLRFADATDAIFDAGMALIDTPFDRVTDMLRVLPDLVRLRADRSVAAFVNRHIRDPRLRQVFSFHPLLVGGNPFQSSSIYALIHTLEQRWGVWFAMGGTGALVQALVRLFTELGGSLRLDCEVLEIVVDAATRRASSARRLRC
jgi:phytoene desaturase